MMKKFTCVIMAFVLVVSFSACGVKNAEGAPLYAYYIDVGQGDSELIEFPNGKHMLIDSGPSSAESSLLTFLNSKNIKKLDYVVITHPHADHIGNMKKVINTYEIGEIYMPNIAANTKTFEKMLDAISDKGLEITEAVAGVNIISEDSLSVDIISPVSPDYDDVNDNSAVVKIVYKNTSLLFMGDAGTPAEKDITADVSADIIKIGHHGSSTSTSEAFLLKVNPKYAVICVGNDNSYNHPSQLTLNLLDKYKIPYYQTNTLGTVTAVSDGNTIEIKVIE